MGNILIVEKMSAFALAAMSGTVQELEACLKAGSKAGEQDENGWTALHFAASGGHRPAVAFLLAQGADPLAKNDAGETAYNLAFKKGHIDTMLLLEKAEKDGQVIRPEDMPEHIRELKRTIAELCERLAAVEARASATPGAAPAEKPAKKDPSVIISGGMR